MSRPEPVANGPEDGAVHAEARQVLSREGFSQQFAKIRVNIPGIGIQVSDVQGIENNEEYYGFQMLNHVLNIYTNNIFSANKR